MIEAPQKTPWTFCFLRNPHKNPERPLRTPLDVSGPVKGASGNRPRQKMSKSVKKYFQHFSTFFHAGQKRQKMSTIFFDTFRQFFAAPIFWPLLGGSEDNPLQTSVSPKTWKIRAFNQEWKLTRSSFKGFKKVCKRLSPLSKFEEKKEKSVWEDSPRISAEAFSLWHVETILFFLPGFRLPNPSPLFCHLYL